MYKQIKFRVRGVSPLMMHNPQLADPLNPFSKELKKITSKRKKTDEDYAEMAKIEFLGGLYLNDKEYPCIPGEMIEAAIVAGAKKNKMGPAAKSGIIVDGNFRLEYKGPKTPDALFADDNFRNTSRCRVGTSAVMRTRPIFKEWECEFVVNYLPDVVSEEDVISFVENAGRLCGWGDWRPRHGRFEVLQQAA